MKSASSLKTIFMRTHIMSILVLSTILPCVSNSNNNTTTIDQGEFTKLDRSGYPIFYQHKKWSNSGTESSGTRWSCVLDTNTGFVWEIKTDSGPRSKNLMYAWGEWRDLVNVANNEQLCGYKDWRVPTVEELKTIVDVHRNNPSANTMIFPNMQSDNYWTSSKYYKTSSKTPSNDCCYAIVIDFQVGESDQFLMTIPAFVRLVRTNK